MYGFSDNLLHTTPMVQIIAVLIILLLGINDRKFKYFYPVIPFLFISSIINARTPFWTMMICIFSYLLTKGINDSKIILGSLVTLAIGAMAIPLVVIILDKNASMAFEYFTTGFDTIGNLFQGNVSSGFFKYAFDDFLVFPDSLLQCLFGAGQLIIEGSRDNLKVHSDIGYINDIWCGGILFMAANLIFHLKYIKTIDRLEIKESHQLMWIMTIFFLIGHFKGILTHFNDYTVIMLLLSTGVALNQSQNTISDPSK